MWKDEYKETISTRVRTAAAYKDVFTLLLCLSVIAAVRFYDYGCLLLINHCMHRLETTNHRSK